MEPHSKKDGTERALSRNLLPARVQDLERKLKSELTLNDLVERVFIELYEDASFHRFLDATSDADSVEGSMAADNLEAANMIREYVKKHEPANPLANKNKVTINLALGVVTRRFGVARKERRERLDGRIVSDNVPTTSGE